MVNAYTSSEAHVMEKDENPLAIAEALTKADILVVRQGGERGLPPLRDAVRAYGQETGSPQEITAKIVYDIDDNVEIISPYSEHYKEYGTNEFVHNGVKVWENGQNGFDASANRLRILSFLKGLREADMVTVTTEKLAEYARQYNPSVVVLPNYLDMSRWWKLPLKPNKQLRVGWSGGISHYEDWYSIKEPLNALMRKYQFKLVMKGSHFDGVIDEDNKHLVEINEWVSFDGYSYHTMALNLDIALIPLADLPFNHYKSSVKWLEFSSLGIPSVVSNILPYSASITQGVNALGYTTNQEFYNSLESLLLSRELREKIGNNAEKHVRANFDAKKNAHQWIDAYQGLF